MARPAGSVMLPAVVVTAPAPLQLTETLGVAATVTPEGSTSASDADRVAGVLFALVSVSVRVEVPPAAMVEGANDMVSVGATVVTVRTALAAAALLPFEVASAPAASVLV